MSEINEASIKKELTLADIKKEIKQEKVNEVVVIDEPEKRPVHRVNQRQMRKNKPNPVRPRKHSRGRAFYYPRSRSSSPLSQPGSSASQWKSAPKIAKPPSPKNIDFDWLEAEMKNKRRQELMAEREVRREQIKERLLARRKKIMENKSSAPKETAFKKSIGLSVNPFTVRKGLSNDMSPGKKKRLAAKLAAMTGQQESEESSPERTSVKESIRPFVNQFQDPIATSKLFGDHALEQSCHRSESRNRSERKKSKKSKRSRRSKSRDSSRTESCRRHERKRHHESRKSPDGLKRHLEPKEKRRKHDKNDEDRSRRSRSPYSPRRHSPDNEKRRRHSPNDTRTARSPDEFRSHSKRRQDRFERYRDTRTKDKNTPPKHHGLRLVYNSNKEGSRTEVKDSVASKVVHPIPRSSVAFVSINLRLLSKEVDCDLKILDDMNEECNYANVELRGSESQIPNAREVIDERIVEDQKHDQPSSSRVVVVIFVPVPKEARQAVIKEYEKALDQISSSAGGCTVEVARSWEKYPPIRVRGKPDDVLKAKAEINHFIQKHLRDKWAH